MRESNARLAEVLAAHYKGGGGGASSGGADHKSSKQVSGKGAGTALGASDSNWWSSVESTKWLKHCQVKRATTACNTKRCSRCNTPTNARTTAGCDSRLLARGSGCAQGRDVPGALL